MTDKDLQRSSTYAASQATDHVVNPGAAFWVSVVLAGEHTIAMAGAEHVRRTAATQVPSGAAKAGIPAHESVELMIGNLTGAALHVLVLEQSGEHLRPIGDVEVVADGEHGIVDYTSGAAEALVISAWHAPPSLGATLTFADLRTSGVIATRVIEMDHYPTFAELEASLRASQDPIDALCLALLPVLVRHGRLTLGDALALAKERNLSDGEALAAIERLARPKAAGLQRFYIDRSGAEPRILSGREISAKLVALGDEIQSRRAWTSAIEVAWASSADSATGHGGGS